MAGTSTFREVMRIVLAAAVMLAGLIVVLGAIVVARPDYVEIEVAGEAMRPTLAPGDRVSVENGVAPRRGDMVVFDGSALPRQPAIPRVLRIIGVGGDRLTYANGTLTVDDAVVTEPYARGTGAAFTVTVPDGTVFLAGDDRRNAVDSRMFVDSADRGAVPTAALRGKVVAVNGALLDDGQAWLTWVAGGAVIALAGLGWLVVGLHRRTAIPAMAAE